MIIKCDDDPIDIIWVPVKCDDECPDIFQSYLEKRRENMGGMSDRYSST